MINLNDKLIREDLAKMKPEAFAVLMAITTHINNRKTAFPKIERLCALTGVGRDTVYKALKRLVELKYIERKQENKKGVFGKTTYRVTTKYLSVWMGVSEVEMEVDEDEVEPDPLTEKPDTVTPQTDLPDTAFQDALSITKSGSINQDLSINEVEENTTPNGIGFSESDFEDFEAQIKAQQSEAQKPPRCAIPPDFEDDITEILETLNLLANRCYTVTGERAKSNRDFVLKLLKKKYTKDEINAVIQTKCFEWVNNIKMSKFLRPATLFGSNFQTYLEEYNNLKSNPHFAEQFKKNVNATKPANTAYDTAKQIADSVARLRAEGY